MGGGYGTEEVELTVNDSDLGPNGGSGFKISVVPTR